MADKTGPREAIETRRSYLAQDEVQSLKERVFHAARVGCPIDILYELVVKDHRIINEVLCHPTEHHNIWDTPLTIAVENGRLSVVRLLVEDFKADAGHSVDSFQKHGDSKFALLAAARHGFMHIVQVLVDNGADVNQASLHKSTPLREACKFGHLAVVQYLLDKGARIDHVDDHGTTCLMSACAHDCDRVAKFLLERGVDPNVTSLNGETALHMAALHNSVRAARVLLKYRPRMVQDNENHTPFIDAIWSRSSEVADLILESGLLAREDKICGLELMGALELDHTATISLWVKAMIERTSDPSNVLMKPSCQPVPILGDVTECQTIDELLSRQQFPVLVSMESILVIERVLGPYFFETAVQTLGIADVLKTSGQFNLAIAVWIYAWTCLRSLDTDDIYIFYIHDLMLQMREVEISPSFSDLACILRLQITRMEQLRTTQERPPEMGETALCTSLMDLALEVERNDDQEIELQTLVRNLLEAHAFLGYSFHLLHAAAHSVVENSFLNVILETHNPRAVEYLLKLGASANVRNCDGNTPLHIIVRCDPHDEIINDVDNNGNDDRDEDNEDVICRITRTLLKAEAHVDVKNRQGQTPLDLAACNEVKVILGDYYPLPLKCLAASAVVQYRGKVPDMVSDFIKLHLPGQS